MRWLITTTLDASLKAIEKRLTALDTQLDHDIPPVPLGEDEQVIAVVGPSDLSQRIANDESILGIYPDSEYELYPDSQEVTQAPHSENHLDARCRSHEPPQARE